MVTLDSFRSLALSFPDATEELHFEKPSFRYKKRIFATLHVPNNRAVLKLTEEDQSVFCAYREEVFFPVQGAWGKKGWTFVDLRKVRKDMLRDALTQAYTIVSSKRGSKKV